MLISGLISAVYSTLNSSQKLDFGIVSDYQKYLMNNGVGGAFVNGSTGDFVSLSVEERKTNIKHWSKYRSNKFRIINHVGHTSIDVAKELAKDSVDKVDAISALAPYYFKITSVEKLVDYCKEVAGSAPDLPFYYYHIPVLSGANILMSEFVAVASKEIENFAGIKFTQENLEDFRKTKNHKARLNVLFGVDELFLKSLDCGAKGWVGSTYNHIAPLYFEIKRLYEKGEVDLAKSLQNKAVLFVETLNSFGGYNGVAKGFMGVLGIDCGPSRFPHNTPDKKTYDLILEKLKTFGLEKYFGKNA